MVDIMQGSDEFENGSDYSIDVTIDLDSSNNDSIEISAHVTEPEYKVEIYNSLTREPVEDIVVDFTMGYKYTSQHHNQQTKKSDDLRIHVEKPKYYEDCSGKYENDTIIIFCTPYMPTTWEKTMDMLHAVLKKAPVFNTFQTHIIRIIAQYFLLDSISFTYWSPQQHQNHIHTVQFSSDLQLMVTASLLDNKIMIWNTNNAENGPIRTFDNQEPIQDAYFFYRDQYIISLTKFFLYDWNEGDEGYYENDNQPMKIWNIKTGELEKMSPLKKSYNSIGGYIKVSENTKLVALTRDYIVSVFEKTNRNVILNQYLVADPNLNYDFERKLSCASCFSKNESLIAANKYEVWAWDIHTGTLKYYIDVKDEIQDFFVTAARIFIKNIDRVTVCYVKDGEYVTDIGSRYGEYICISADDQFMATFDFSGNHIPIIHVYNFLSGDKIIIPLRPYTAFQQHPSQSFHNAFSILDNEEYQLVFIGSKVEDGEDANFSTNTINTYALTTKNSHAQRIKELNKLNDILM